MKIFSYIRYFLYIAFNWNLRIAWYIVRQEIKGEKKYGIDTTGADELKHLEKKGIDIQNATIYMPANYAILEELYGHINLSSYSHFLDIGCGKGRALCVAAHFGMKRITGIDLSKKLCTAAEKNLAITHEQFPALQYSVVNNDAFYYEIPPTVDCIFMFNPFDDVILSGVADNILESYESDPRPITIIYVNPMHKQELLDIGFREVYHTKKMKYLEAVVLQLD